MVEQRQFTTVCVVSSLTFIALALVYRHRSRRERREKTADGDFSSLELDEKPQRHFRNVLADNSLRRFQHLESGESGIDFPHPYGQRIRALLEQPPPRFLLQDEFKAPRGMEGPYEWVDTKDQLEALAIVLSNETEFAVDTEQHSYHSFHGFTALVQISTQQTDFLVDTIALHDYMSLLQGVISNPAICKVFHGADSDILWLQRDFHLYVVNMFDTAKACIVLDKPQRSLAYLLKSYCNVITNKAYQRADWRIRPLTEDMLEYARTDAHYLLYIAQQLSRELRQQSTGGGQQPNTDLDGALQGHLLEQALYRANVNCLQLFEKEEVPDLASTASTIVSRFRFLHGSPPPSQALSSTLSTCIFIA